MGMVEWTRGNRTTTAAVRRITAWLKLILATSRVTPTAAGATRLTRAPSTSRLGNISEKVSPTKRRTAEPAPARWLRANGSVPRGHGPNDLGGGAPPRLQTPIVWVAQDTQP